VWNFFSSALTVGATFTGRGWVKDWAIQQEEASGGREGGGREGRDGSLGDTSAGGAELVRQAAMTASLVGGECMERGQNEPGLSRN